VVSAHEVTPVGDFSDIAVFKIYLDAFSHVGFLCALETIKNCLIVNSYQLLTAHTV
jgi:hypothetical protein